jgi:O-methyltransferase involved in polyketide biosynthesis
MTAATGIDASNPDPARRYDYWLGGKDNFAVDRESGDRIAAAFPPIRVAARENRAFLKRAVQALAQEGVDQFLDVGAGLPSADNTHEVAQRLIRAARVVYVDNSPLVLAHARALLTAAPGAPPTTVVEADLRDPAAILAAAREHLDFTRPVGLLLVAVLHFLPDDAQAYAAVTELVGALPPGSFLALSHVSTALLSAELRERWDAVNADAGIPMASRDHGGVARFFTGLEVVPPGIVSVQRWRPDDARGELPNDASVGVYGGVGRKG